MWISGSFQSWVICPLSLFRPEPFQGLDYINTFWAIYKSCCELQQLPHSWWPTDSICCSAPETVYWRSGLSTVSCIYSLCPLGKPFNPPSVREWGKLAYMCSNPLFVTAVFFLALSLPTIGCTQLFLSSFCCISTVRLGDAARAPMAGFMRTTSWQVSYLHSFLLFLLL